MPDVQCIYLWLNMWNKWLEIDVGFLRLMEEIGAKSALQASSIQIRDLPQMPGWVVLILLWK